MRVLTGNEASEAWDFFFEAAAQARKATCLRSKCGAVIVKGRKVIGEGFNSPPGWEENRKCHLVTSLSPNPRHDQTCCVHAEWRAIFDALRRFPERIEGSILYFTRIDENGNIKISGKPYCTVCSRLALDAGIAYFALFHDSGITLYDTKEYNDLSYEYERPTL